MANVRAKIFINYNFLQIKIHLQIFLKKRFFGTKVPLNDKKAEKFLTLFGMTGFCHCEERSDVAISNKQFNLNKKYYTK
jgi:hypothetical protein